MEHIESYSMLAGLVIPVLVSMLKQKFEFDKKELRLLTFGFALVCSALSFFDKNEFSFEVAVYNLGAILTTAEFTYQWVMKYVERTYNGKKS